MKRAINLCLFLLLAFPYIDAQQAPAVTSGLRETNDKKDTSININKAKEVMGLVSKILQGSHYDGHPLDDNVSKKVFELFINRIDPGKYLLLSEDILLLKKMELTIDDELLNNKMELQPESHKIKKIRIEQVEAMYQKILSTSIDISKTEKIVKDPKNMTWCNSLDELNNRWKEIIHQMVVSSYVFLLIEKEQADIAEKKAKEKAIEKPIEKTPEVLKTEPPKSENNVVEEIDLIDNNAVLGQNKPAIDYDKLSKLPIDEEKLKIAQEKVKKNLDIRFKRLKEEGEVGNFNIYMNALCGAFDPHTAYHLPEEKEAIDIDLTGTLQGIGAQLQENGDEVKVTKIIAGSASWKQKQLGVGDVILKVGQGSQEAVDIRGMNLSESVRLIRGKKGTEVRLTVKKPDGQIIIIPIIRDVVVLEDSYVHSVIIDDKATGQKLGYILLPSFYLEQENGKGRSCAAGVKVELMALKDKGVDGIIFDLRTNGGGSLKDVIDMTGFFINEGPIVQVRGQANMRKVYDDPDTGIVYDGPLVVMTSNMSASASEIFAAALQDYGRAVILGLGMTSYGKGTVQTFVPLQEYSSNKKFDIGALRLSIQKFYRINGQTTQFKGVIPDIVLPVEYMYMDIGEQFLDNPLPSDVFFPTKYEKWEKGPDVAKIKELSKERVKKNAFLNKVEEYALYLKNRREEKTMSISVVENLKELAESQAKNSEFIKLKEKKREMIISKITVANNKDSGMFKEMETSLPNDQYVFEAMEIIKDIRAKPAVEAK